MKGLKRKFGFHVVGLKTIFMIFLISSCALFETSFLDIQVGDDLDLEQASQFRFEMPSKGDLEIVQELSGEFHCDSIIASLNIGYRPFEGGRFRFMKKTCETNKAIFQLKDVSEGVYLF